MVLSQRLRYGLVCFGLVACEAIFAAKPSGDLNGDVPLFPDATIWFGSLLVAWAVLMSGMFSGEKGRKTLGPLIIGTVGAAALIVTNI